MKPQPTTTHTNTPRRAPPAAVRAALRLRDLIIRNGFQSIALTLLLLTLPSPAAQAVTGSVSGGAVAAQTAPHPTIYQPPASDLRLKVWGGEILIHRGYANGKWHPNLNWMPLAFTYDSFDNSIKTVTRSRTEYTRAAAGVYQDQNGNLLRQTANGFRWNNPAGSCAIGDRPRFVERFAI